MQVSPAGQAFIKKEEALRLRPYADGVGFMTIGWGHLVRPEDNLDGVPSISKAKAQELLDKDLEEVQNALGRLVKVDLTQGQYDALASFVFNLGEEKVKNATLFRKLNLGDYKSVSSELSRWVYAGGRIVGGPDGKSGLVGRRRREGEMFNADIQPVR